MWLQIGLFVVGLVVLLAGGEALVRGASSLARRLGMSSAVIGLTVVAFGTSAPELVVSLLSAWKGTSEIAFGNVFGSNVANLGLLLGLTALLLPLRVDSTILSREIPLLVLVSVAAVFLGMDSWFTGEPDVFSRSDGWVLVLFFAVFLYANARDVLRGSDPMLKEAVEEQEGDWTLRRAIVFTLLGLVGLAVGGQFVVGAAVEIARAAGLSEVVIGATIVAIGTSLPELVTCIAAARKGHDDLALGNLVGSNVFNLLFVLGITSAVSPVPVPTGGWIDLMISLLLAAALLPMARSGRRISRVEGALMLLAYIGYSVWQTTLR